MTNELHRVMIFRTNPRTLRDGCESCGKSLTYCDAAKHHGHESCCGASCQHP